ncbi:hypothetical protein ANANG_G00286880 [Anguilla anguilla]|uniref:Clathrin adaptor alpha/beta/gamma-adaptin appendage Ig-like subdomain domain-containing protein n=1 Tax=Anguilla anguilla TaxID=7936 RepID=A0A9D3LJE5_ANGAN|nr:hypothetical protein ANANG_G00286880 [Anguilla anguilla]
MTVLSRLSSGPPVPPVLGAHPGPPALRLHQVHQPVPETKPTIQEVLRSDSQIRNSDVELQQRAVEYLKLSSIASTDVLATVLEEMPPFPERESSILAKLKKKKGPGPCPCPSWRTGRGRGRGRAGELNGGRPRGRRLRRRPVQCPDLLGLRPAAAIGSAAPGAGSLLVDVFSEAGPAAASSGVNDEGFLSSEDSAPPLPESNELLSKFVCKNNGVLFENQLLQIGIKSEYRQNLGRMYLFYGNKTSVQFASFCTVVSCPGELQAHILCVLCPGHTPPADLPVCRGGLYCEDCSVLFNISTV